MNNENGESDKVREVGSSSPGGMMVSVHNMEFDVFEESHPKLLQKA